MQKNHSIIKSNSDLYLDVCRLLDIEGEKKKLGHISQVNYEDISLNKFLIPMILLRVGC